MCASRHFDPFKSAVEDWQGRIPKDPHKAWDLALQGYTFLVTPETKIGPFTNAELQDIASYRPVVSYDNYLAYRGMTINELYQLIPGLKELLEASNANKSDYKEWAFYFATRRWIPSDADFSRKIDRWEQYTSLEYISQRLIDMIYGSPGNSYEQNAIAFAISLSSHPLEIYILTFDQLQGLPVEMDNLATSLGLAIPIDEDADVYVYDQMRKYLEWEKNKRPPIYPGPLRIPQ
jgi:hypothetical protein